MMEALMADMRARSAIGPHASWLRTWTRFHHRWWGSHTSPWPLSPPAIYAVAAIMKDAGYRSFPNYASAAKDSHIQLGFPWSDQLRLAVTRATASTQRGIGAPHQCSELLLPSALSVIHDDAPLVHMGPMQCRHMFILGYYHVVRGIELAMALACHLTVDLEASLETWHLPVSKTDPQAIGCSRSWGCTCAQSTACPFHAAVAHLEWLRTAFGTPTRSLPRDLPLFPTADGKHTSPERLTASITAIATRLGRDLTDDLGRTAYSEHIFRVSGSRMLARAGVPVELIKLLARWSTAIVDRYIGDAPLECLTDRFCAAPSGINFADLPLPTVPVSGSLASSSADAAQTPAVDPAVVLRLDQIETQVQLIAEEIDPEFLLNHRSGVYHRRGTFGIRASPSLWRAPCGWYFGASGAQASWFTAVTETSPDLICPTCLPQLLLALREMADMAPGSD